MGVRIERSFHELSVRYHWDFEECPFDQGWCQIDTRQDAPYYGTWCSADRREIVNFCEGDLTRTICDTDEEFVEQLRDFRDHMDAGGWGPCRIDPGLVDAVRARYVALGAGDLLHPDISERDQEGEPDVAR